MSMGGSGGSSGGRQENIIRYAGYIESAHQNIINNSNSYGNSLRGSSPYTTFVAVDFDDAIYGSGYILSSFPSLYDMYGKFIGGVDITALFEQVLNQVASSETIQNLSEAHRDLLEDDIEQNILPRFRSGMRDINSVMSSTFLIGEAVIEQGKVKLLAEYDAKLQYNLINVSINVFGQHLQWNSQVVAHYLDIIKVSAAIKIDENRLNYEIIAKSSIWPFTVMSSEIGIIGALQGAMNQKTTNSTGVSTASSIIGGAMGGAALGASAGGVPGAFLGGILGGLAGLISS